MAEEQISENSMKFTEPIAQIKWNNYHSNGFFSLEYVDYE